MQVKSLPRPSVDWLLVLAPLSWALALGHQTVAAFAASALALIPLAALIGRSTEQIAIRSGPRLGGLLNATFGNLTELILSVSLVAAGQFAIVKASLAGAILSNLLAVLGLSFLAGGIRHKEQTFNARTAGVHSASLFLAVTALVLPAVFLASTNQTGFIPREVISGVVAGVLIAIYFGALLFTHVTHAHLFHTPESTEEPRWTLRLSVMLLLGAAIIVGVESELLVDSLGPTIGSLHISPLFVGLILIPIVGNVAENSSAVFFAMRDRLDVTLEVAIGSSTQIALFLAPALVFISLALGRPMDFFFNTFEVVVVGLATLVMSVIALDGRTNWLEGTQLLGAYLITAVCAFFLR